MTSWDDFPKHITPSNPFAKAIEFVNEDTGEVITPDQLVEADFRRSLYIKWYPKDAAGKFMYTRGQRHTNSKVGPWRPRWIEGKDISVEVKDKPSYTGYPFACLEPNAMPLDARGVPVLPKWDSHRYMKQSEDRLLRHGGQPLVYITNFADVEQRTAAKSAYADADVQIYAAMARRFYAGAMTGRWSSKDVNPCAEVSLPSQGHVAPLSAPPTASAGPIPRLRDYQKAACEWLVGEGWDKPLFVVDESHQSPIDDLQWITDKDEEAAYPPLVCNQDIISAAARYGQPVDDVLAYINEERAGGWNCEVKLYDGLPTIHEEYADGSPAIVTRLYRGYADDLYAEYLDEKEGDEK